VADIEAIHTHASERGAEFLTPPVDHGPSDRCYFATPTGT